jgi:hypothetical protein
MPTGRRFNLLDWSKSVSLSNIHDPVNRDTLDSAMLSQSQQVSVGWNLGIQGD